MDGSSQDNPKMSVNKPHVAIIGAGLAGLRCTDILLSHGLKVTVLEGRDRIGGRIHQEKLPNGHYMDMGANWIHGTNENPIMQLANKTGTQVGSWDSTSHVFDEYGHLLPVKEGEIYSNLMWDIVQDAFKYSNEFTAKIDEKESLHDFFVRKVAEKIPETEDDYERKKSMVMQISDMWGNFVGSHIRKQSLKFFWLEECLEGENLFCAGTYKRILDAIAEPALTKADVRLNTTVEKISCRTDPLSRVSITVKGGEIQEFDEVVVTSPLGWLKQRLDAFSPPLPSSLSDAIESIGYGSLEKVCISFPTAFWKPKEDDGDENESGVKGFIQWVSPKYAPDSNPESWNQEVVELASLTPEASHPTLLFYIYGAQSEYLTRQTLTLKTENAKRDFLIAFFKPYFSRLPHYSESDPLCQPTSVLATDWLHDDLAGNGSYSNFQVGLKDGGKDIEIMRHGVPERGLWLAGEHTSPFIALGTATGAYWSGENVGKRIAKAYDMD